MLENKLPFLFLQILIKHTNGNTKVQEEMVFHVLRQVLPVVFFPNSNACRHFYFFSTHGTRPIFGDPFQRALDVKGVSTLWQFKNSLFIDKFVIFSLPQHIETDCAGYVFHILITVLVTERCSNIFFTSLLSFRDALAS
jgi:hypothetical protein